MMLQRPNEFFIAIIFVLRLCDIPFDAVPFDAALGTLRIDIRGERVDRILEEDGFRLRRLEFTKDTGTAVSDVAPILILSSSFSSIAVMSMMASASREKTPEPLPRSVARLAPCAPLE